MNNKEHNPSNKELNIELLDDPKEQEDDEQKQDDKYKNFDYDENINIDNTLYSNRNTFAPKSNTLNKIKKNKEPLFEKFDSRKTYNKIQPQGKETIFKKRITEFLLKKNKEIKLKRNKTEINKDLFGILYDDDAEETEEDNDFETDFNSQNDNGTKFKSLVRNLIKTKRANEWNEYMESYTKRVKESQTLRYKLKTIFHIDSDFIVIWKTTLRIFNIFVLFIFFFKFVFLNLNKIESVDSVQKRILLIYNMINIMFFIDLIFSVLILIFNGGSVLSYIKLPLKIYTVYPFELKSANFYYLLPKFIRVDIFQKIFSSWESFINLRVELYIHNYHLKIFITCLTQMIKYLLIFGIYAHLNCCILSYFEGIEYASSLFYTIEAFTVVGFGEQSPQGIQSKILVILNLLIGVNLFSLMSSNIKNLSDKIYSFNRDTSFHDNFEFMIFQMQKSIGKILPLKIKQNMESFLLFRRGMSFIDIKDEYKNIFEMIKKDLINQIHRQLFEFLKLEFQNYFFIKNKDNDFMYEIFENLKPKIFRADKVLIKYGEKVNKLYFLLSGQIYATDNNNKPIFTMIDNSIFGDYEFITNTLSCFNIRVIPKKEAYGFILDRDSWEKVSNNHVMSANNFIEQTIIKRKQHMQWIKPNSKKLFDAPPNEIKKNQNLINNKDYDLNGVDTRFNNNSWKDKNDLSGINNMNINIGEKKNEKKEKEINKKIVKNVYDLLSDLNIERIEKAPKYNHPNIIKNIEICRQKCADMIRKVFYLVCVLLLSMTATVASAYDFKSGNLCYTIVSKTEHTVEVAYGNTRHANKVVVPDEVTYEGQKWKVVGLGPDAFYDSGRMTELVLPRNLKYIAGGSLERCYELKQVELPAGVTLRTYALRNSGITSIRVPGNVKWGSRHIGQLSNLPKVTSILLEEGIESIPDAAFQFDASLEYLTLPTSLRHIGRYAFVGCSALTRLDIPVGVRTIGRLVDFGDCALKEIHVHWQDPIQIAGNTFPQETYMNAVLYVPRGSKGNYRASVGWCRFKNIIEED